MGGVLLLNLFVFTLVGLFMQQSHRQYQERAEITSQNLTQTLDSEIAGAIETDDVALFAVIDEYRKQRAGGGVDGKALNAYIERIRSRRPEIDALRITDGQGVIVYGNDVAPGARTSLADRPHFARLRDNPQAGLVISKPQVSRVNQEWVIVLARRIDQPDGSFGGMAFAAITLDHLSKTFAAINIGARGVVTMVDGELNIVVRHPEPQRIDSGTGQKLASPTLGAMVRAGRKAGTYQASSAVDGIERTFAYRQIGDHPLLIIVGLATADYLAAWRHEAAEQAALAALFALMTLAAAWLIYRIWKRQVNSVMALARQEAKFHTWADFTFDWEYWKGPQGEILYMTPSCERVTGYTRDEFIAEPGLLVRIIHPEDRQVLEQHLHTIASRKADHDEVQVDFRILRRDGEIRWIAHHCRVISSDDGESMGRRVGNRDITERKLALAALRESENRHRLLVENSPLCIHEIDMAGRITSMNRAGLAMMGVDEESGVCGLSYLDAVCAADRKRIGELLTKAYGGETSQFEFMASGPNGQIFKSCFAPIKNENGDVIRLMGITENITERMQAEAALYDLNRDFVTFLENATDFIYFKDRDSRFRFCSQSMAVVTGHASWRDMIGKHDFDVFPQDAAQIYYEEELPVFRDGIPLLDKTNLYYDVQGTRRWVSTNKWPVFDSAGHKVIGIFGISRDITEYKRVAEELQHHHQHLEDMVAQRTAQLLALTTELAMAEERERRAIAQDLHDDLGQILAIVKLRLTSLETSGGSGWHGDMMRQVKEIEAMVDRANRSVRSLSMQLSPPVLYQFGLVPALEWLAEEMHRAYGLHVRVHDEGNSAKLGEALSSSLFRTVRELLINVAKHAEADAAEVSVLTDGDKLVISVADAGVGFDAQQRMTPSAEGGYGLFSVRERLNAIGGEMQIDSRLGDGTVVVLTLPLDAIKGRSGR